MIGTHQFLPSMGRGTSRRLVEGRRASGGTLSAPTAFPPPPHPPAPPPLPGRNCVTCDSHFFETLGGSGSANAFLPSMGRGTSRRLVEGRRASGGTLSARIAFPPPRYARSPSPFRGGPL
jgi:hypothetical protein